MSNTEFKVGDVVQLKSGGPKMTVEGVGKYGFSSDTPKANCVWFEGTKHMEKTFEPATLRKIM